MKSQNFWKENYKKPTCSKLNKSIETDVLVVGGGIAGVFAAYYLNKQGRRVVLIDAKEIGAGATGNSAGYLTLEPDITTFAELVDELGEVETKRYWENLKQAQRDVLNIITQNKIKCEHFFTDTLYVNTNKDFAESALKDLYLRIKNDLSAEVLTDKGKVAELDLQGVNSLEKVEQSLCLNPFKFINEFAKVTNKKGVEVYEKTEMLSLKGNECTTKSGSIKFNKALVCVDSFGEGKIQKLLTTIAITEKLSKGFLKKIKLDDNDATLWNTNNSSFFYTRNTLDNRILIGYGDKPVKKGEYKIKLDKQHLDMIKGFLKKRIDQTRKIKIDYAWSGIFGKSTKNIPEIKVEEDVVYLSGSATQLVAISFVKQIVDKNFMVE